MLPFTSQCFKKVHGFALKVISIRVGLTHSLLLTVVDACATDIVLKRVWEMENIAHSEQFLHFPKCFLLFSNIVLARTCT